MRPKFLLALLLTPLVLGGLVAFAPRLIMKASYFRVPNDSQLISKFLAHRTAFERLREIALQDSKSRSFFRQHQLDDMAPDRREEYESLLTQIGPGFDVGTDQRTVRFIAAVGGSWISIGPEWVKGIEYIPLSLRGLEPFRHHLDDVRSLEWGNVYLRQIDQDWFVFVQKTD